MRSSTLPPWPRRARALAAGPFLAALLLAAGPASAQTLDPAAATAPGAPPGTGSGETAAAADQAGYRLAAGLGLAAAELLPPGTEYDPAVPPPEAVLGFRLGERHVEPHEIVRYARRLAETSPRVRLEVQGTSWEGREQVLLTFAAPERLGRLEEVRRAHLARLDPIDSEPDSGAPGAAAGDDAPVVVWLGYSIHGNEASGANASLAVAWYLAAARGPEVEALLERAVVLLDPALNPDGLARFAGWANQHAGAEAVADPEHREHRETWPGGRTNHYGFDLNRDWLLLQQPESQARAATFRRWMPNLSGDWHEMGSERTFFFQPGVASRWNPSIPEANRELTAAVARRHAAALDAAGSLYYTAEGFDDFYPGKGSTYPDVNGGVGLLFEQGSARGRAIDTPRGERTLAAAVANQVRTSLAMLTAARELRGELLDYQAAFFRESRQAARRDPVRGWAVAFPGDPVRGEHFRRLLAGHGVELERPAKAFSAAGRRFAPEDTWIVAADQPAYRLLGELFSTRTEFADTTFYDVSAWTLPLAFGAPWARLDAAALAAALPAGRSSAEEAGEELAAPAGGAVPPAAGGTAYAWLLDWTGYGAPRALDDLLAAGARAAVATRPFTADTAAGRLSFAAGTVVVGAGDPTEHGPDAGELARLVAEAAGAAGARAWGVAGGLTPEGIDLGSPSVVPLVRPRPMLVVGDGVSGYEAGEIWHLLDQRWGMPLSLVDRGRLAQADLGRYTHVLMVDGDYSSLSDAAAEALTGWVRRGGVVVAGGRAAAWAGERLLGIEPAEGRAGAPPGRVADPESPPGLAAGRPASGAAAEPVAAGGPGETGGPGAGPADGSPAGDPAGSTGAPVARAAYAEFDRDRQASRVSGAVFAAELDLTHPLAFGYSEPLLPVFRNSARVLAPSANPYENVALLAAEPLVAGYASEENRARAAGSAALVATRLGRGAVVRYAFDPAFRGYWFGTHKLVANALFFASAIERTELDEP
jgi:hypothetical protein